MASWNGCIANRRLISGIKSTGTMLPEGLGSASDFLSSCYGTASTVVLSRFDRSPCSVPATGGVANVIESVWLAGDFSDPLSSASIWIDLLLPFPL